MEATIKSQIEKQVEKHLEGLEKYLEKLINISNAFIGMTKDSSIKARLAELTVRVEQGIKKCKQGIVKEKKEIGKQKVEKKEIDVLLRELSFAEKLTKKKLANFVYGVINDPHELYLTNDQLNSIMSHLSKIYDFLKEAKSPILKDIELKLVEINGEYNMLVGLFDKMKNIIPKSMYSSKTLRDVGENLKKMNAKTKGEIVNYFNSYRLFFKNVEEIRKLVLDSIK